MRQAMEQPMGDTNNEEGNLPTLEMVLLAFQKGVARAAQATNDASKHDPNFLTGKRTLYAVDSLDVDLSAGLKINMEKGCASEDKIRVDFDAPAQNRSRLKFTVEPKPLEPINGPRILITRIHPLSEGKRVNHFLIWYIDENNLLKPSMDISIIFKPSGKGKTERILQTTTDLTGQFRFNIDPVSGIFESASTYKPRNFKLDMALDWFVSVRLKEKEEMVSIELPIVKQKG